MKRRNFIRSAVSALPLVLAEPLAHALQAQTTSARQTPVVAAGEDRFGETHAPGYSDILFKTSSHETPSLFAIEHGRIQPGWGPPLHLHPTQEEWFYVIDGEVLIQVGDRRVHLKPGDSALGPRMVPHAFTAVGPKAARMVIVFTPAGQMEQFFRDTASVGPQQAAAVYSHYGMNRLGPPISQS